MLNAGEVKGPKEEVHVRGYEEVVGFHLTAILQSYVEFKHAKEHSRNKRFAEEGFEVFITGRRDSFPEFNYVKADVRDYDALERAVRVVVGRAGGIDVLVANAGVAYVAPVKDTPVEKWREVVDVNLTGVFHTVKAALPHMREGGHIFVMGSIASVRAFPGWALYCATKFDTDLWEGLAYVPRREKMMKPEDVAEAVWDAYNNRAWVRDLLILPPDGII